MSRKPAASPPRTPYVGRSVHRIEDARLVTGRARWTDTIAVDDALYLAVVRSPMAHAKIVGVDLSSALAHPSVVAAFSGADLAASWKGAMPVAGMADPAPPAPSPLPADKVRFVGEPVAVVLATSAADVEDVLELVDVDYQPLPAVSSISAALRDESLVHAEHGTNRVYRFAGKREGDLAAALERADVVVTRRYVQPRVMATALEVRTTLVEPMDDGRLVVHTSTQVPHRIKQAISTVLGVDPERIHVIAPDVGGGFGPKLDPYPEDYLCAELALRLGRAVRYVGTRSEDFQTTYHGRGQIQEVTVAASEDGEFLGLKVEVTGDCGAYVTRAARRIQTSGDQVSPGCYRWGAFQFDAVGVYTNSVPTAAYRGAGRPEAIYGVERTIDEVAAALEVDPAELRRRNFPAESEFPFRSIGGLTYDSGAYADVLDGALRTVEYERWRSEQRRRLATDDPRAIGIGIAAFVDRCGTGPGISEYGSVRVDAGGWVEVKTGLGPTGQGTATSLSQLVADALGVDMAQVRVVAGDTDLVRQGGGTFGSRSMSVGGVAVVDAADDVVRRACDVAADVLGVTAGDLAFVGGRFSVRGKPEESLSLFDVAAAVSGGECDGTDELVAESEYEPSSYTFPYGIHVAVVEVDTETGKVALLRYVAGDDIGEMINVALVNGQLQGGLAQGIAQALYEEAVHDEDGNLVTGSLVDYLAPTAPDLPDLGFYRHVTRGPNRLGTKGVGESGTVGGPPAVVNAVANALRPLGVEGIEMPCTPLRVWQAIECARGPQPG